jgi:hypothetical protein
MLKEMNEHIRILKNVPHSIATFTGIHGAARAKKLLTNVHPSKDHLHLVP